MTTAAAVAEQAVAEQSGTSELLATGFVVRDRQQASDVLHRREVWQRLPGLSAAGHGATYSFHPSRLVYPLVRRSLERNSAVPLQGLKPAIGFAASLLAVCWQVFLLATISLAPLAIGADPVENVPICHADEGTQPAQRPPGHPGHDCALCALCVSHALPLALLSSGPTPYVRHSVVAVRRDAAQPRAPPVPSDRRRPTAWTTFPDLSTAAQHRCRRRRRRQLIVRGASQSCTAQPCLPRSPA